MGNPEVYTNPGNLPHEGNNWATILSDHTRFREYQSILHEVPAWGQGFLVDLQRHHPDSFDHSLRVAATVDAVLNGRYVGEIPPETVTVAALLHDVKKDVVPLTILDKNGPLTVEERSEVRPHAIEVYSTIEQYSPLIAQLAGGHHLYQPDPYGHEEAMNTTWDAAAGQQLIAAADAVDALGSRRSYKPPWPPERVRETLLGDGILSPVLIDRVVTARFQMPPFGVSREAVRAPRSGIIFQV